MTRLLFMDGTYTYGNPASPSFNVPLLGALIAFIFAQVAKIFTHWYAEGKLDLGRLVGSGGMPSSHTAFVVGLTTAVAVRDGMGSSVFGICLVFSLVVMYDATGVRHHAGRHATALNIIIAELPSDHPVQDTGFGRLRDSLGHTPVQVAAGAILGVAVGYVVQGIASLHGGSAGGLPPISR